MEEMNEPIIHRLHKLKDAINSCGINFEDAQQSRNLLAHEGLLDAVVVLYDECSSDTFIQTPVVNAFINKYKNTIHELRRLRVNVNDFEQKTVIGKGNFGIVQVVREKQTGNVYAMKTLRKLETLAQQHVTFYEEERDIMAKCDSQWITKLQYTFQDEKNLYLIMEFHPGGDLLSLLDRFEYSFTEDMIQFYLCEIVTSLHVLHTMGYVHRDVKPENILIDRCGHIKLADFGSAAKLSKIGLVDSKMAIGTPEYLAPEVLSSMNDSKESSYGVECDFWSVGIMAYEMFYGETPFHAEDVASTYSKIMNYKTSLKFNDNIAITPELKNIIKCFLCGGEARMSYNEVIKHKFFLYTDWHNLQSVKPPFIPVISSLDDTSNFEDFEHEKRVPEIESFRSKQNYSGRDLPFIGFTYVRESNTERRSMRKSTSSILNLEESRKNSTHLEEQLNNKKKELHEAKLHLKSLEGGDNCRKVQQSEKRAVLAETKLLLVDKERTRIEEELNKMELLLQKSRQDLTNEKSQRAKTESKTLEFLRDIKEKWRRDEATKLAGLNEKIENYQKGAEANNDAKKDALENLYETTLQLNETKRIALKFKAMVKEKEEVINSLRRQSMDNRCTGSCNAASDLSMDLERASSNLKTEIDKREHLNNDFEGLKENLLKQDEIIARLQDNQRKSDEKLSEAFDQLEKKSKECDIIRRQEEENRRTECIEQNVKLHKTEELLKAERNESKSLKRKLDDISRNMHNSLQTQNKQSDIFQSREANLQQELKKLNDDVKSLCKEREDLQSRLTVFTNREGYQMVKIKELEELIVSLKNSLRKLESKKSSEIDGSLGAQIKLLEKQLKVSQSAGEADREKLHIVEDSLRKKQKEFTDLKLDFRGIEREIKSTQDTVKFLRENNRELRAQEKEKEEQIKTLQNKENDLHEESSRINIIYSSDLKMKDEIIDQHQNKITALKQKIQVMEEIHNKLEESKTRLKETQSICDEAKLAKRAFECDLKMNERTIANLEKNIATSKEEQEKVQEKLKRANIMIDQLKDICSEQDEQLGVVDQFNWKLQQAEDEKDLLQDQIQNLQKEVKSSKANANEEISLKLFNEKKLKDIEKKLTEIKDENEAITMSEQQVKDDYAKELADTYAQINDLQVEIIEINTKLRSFDHQIIEMEGAAEILRDENAGHIQHIHNMKESNFMLTDGLEEAISKGEMFKKRVIELEKNIESAILSSADKELRMGSTIQQQTKLIDFLQTKTENPPKKKIALSRLFGNSSNKENTIIPRYYRDLEHQLASEKLHIQNISSQLSKAHMEISALKAKENLKEISRIVTTPLGKSARKVEVSALSSIEKSSKPIMKHKIPHRWNSHLVMRAGRCAGCMGSIPFSLKVARCQECRLLAHTKCCTAIAHTCGLPQEFAFHFSAASKSSRKKNNDQIIKSGWIKILRRSKSIWERRYTVLSQLKLHFYEQKPVEDMQPLKTLELETCTISVTRSVYKSELPTLNSSELPFVLKVSFDAKTGRSTSVYILTQSFDEKRLWIKAFESFQIESKSEHTDSQQSGAVLAENLLSSKSHVSMDCNCLVALDEKMILVGATEGLFLFELDKDVLSFKTKINGFESVQQIVVVEQTGVAVFVSGAENLVYLNDVVSLAAAAEVSSSTLSPKLIPTLIGCHLIAASDSTQSFLCAASSDRISILTWDNSMDCYEVRREYGTLEPCSCLLFTQNSLIVGSERFYKIDLNNFSIEELLDEKDNSLAYAIHGSTQMSSYPVAVIQISPSNTKEEFLLAFYEFGIFVDESGRRTRDSDVKFSSLPLALSFASPHLFILYENTVEVIEVQSESFIGEVDFSTQIVTTHVKSVARQFSKPRYLGEAPFRDGIVVATTSQEGVILQTVSASFGTNNGDHSPILSANAFQQADIEASDTLMLRSELSTTKEESSSNIGSTKRTGISNVLRSPKKAKRSP